MKYFFSLLFAVAFLIPADINGQEYSPMVVDDVNWLMMHSHTGKKYQSPFLFRIEGDTLIGNISYKKLYVIPIKIISSSFSLGKPKIFGYLREDVLEKKVYGLREEFYDYDLEFFTCKPLSEEYLLYDFGVGVGDSIKLCENDNFYLIDTVLFRSEFGESRKTFQTNNSDLYLIEGIGPNTGPFISSKKHNSIEYYIDKYCEGDPDDCVQEYFAPFIGGLVSSGYRWDMVEYYYRLHSFSNRIMDLELIDGIPRYYIQVRDQINFGNMWLKSGWLHKKDSKIYINLYDETRLLYDFSLGLMDEFESKYGILNVTSLDSITLLNGEKKKSITLTCQNSPYDEYTWVEDLGDITFGLMSPLNYCAGYDSVHVLLCLYENEELIYNNADFSNCGLFTSEVENLRIRKFLAYPNPVDDELIIEYDWKSKPHFKIYNLEGRQLIEGKIEKNKINVSDLMTGLYILVANDDNSTFSSKFYKN